MSAEKQPRVRFAPSPTGELHLGNLRTALFNWLYARRRGGKFILRIDDTDKARTSEKAEKEIYEILRWLELDWDEGPVGYKKGGEVGEYGPYRQSERLKIYQEFLDQLLKEKKAYPCFCSPEELERERELARRAKRAYRYSGKCRKLSEEERERRIKNGEPYSLRLLVEPKVLKFKDHIRGELSTNSKEIGDFIIRRSDGIPTYNFTCAVDDALMKISLVIRAEDHLHNTFAQLLVYQALGFEPPEFAHLPLIVDKNRKPLSKRAGAVSARYFKEKGFLSQAVFNYLALLGFSHPEAKELLSREELIESFSLKRVSKSPAVFDLSRLEWFNRKHIHRLSADELLKESKEYLEKAGLDLNSLDKSWLKKALASIQDNIRTLAEIPQWLKIYLEPPKKKELAQLIELASSKEIIARAYKELSNSKKLDENLLLNIFAGKPKKEIYTPLRIALTGKKSGPAMRDLLELLKPEEMRARLELALEVLKEAESGRREDANQSL